MKKLFGYIHPNYWMMILSIALFASCSEDEIINEQATGLGYLQVEVTKKIQTFAMTNGEELENLNDAKKIQIDLLYNNRQVSQTLNLFASSEESAEYGLTSESVELAAGEYQLTAYRIFGEYQEGVTEGDKAPILQEGSPDEETSFTIVDSELELLPIDVVAQRNGKLSIILDKDFSSILPKSEKALVDFDYNDIEKLDVMIREGAAGSLREISFKAYRRGYLIHTDTVSLREDSYQMEQMLLKDKNDNVIMVLDEVQSVAIENQVHTLDTVVMDMPLTAQYNDYIALYNIWKAMDGENWSWQGYGLQSGVNWLFTYSDGTPRPLDMWGSQPGVSLNPEGRVASINIGGFNPKGMVPDAIGELTQLTSLYLGSHSDVNYVDAEEGNPVVLDRYTLEKSGVDLAAERINIAKERFEIKRPKTQSSLSTFEISKKPLKYAIPADMDISNRTNRITGISEAIGNCTELTMLSVANGLVQEFPVSMANLTKLTDLEIYRCPLTEVPAFIKELPELVALNFSGMVDLNQERAQVTLAEIFDGPSMKKLQLLYLNDNNLESLPANLSNLTSLGLLDVAFNKLVHLPMLGDDVALIECLLDGNDLVEIPNDWFRVDDLEKLSATGNKLTMFPNMFDAKSIYKIKEVNLSGNLINSFPADFKGINVEILNISENKLTEFPLGFAKTESPVTFLQLSTNLIDTVSPDAIKLRFLEALEIKSNKLRRMPVEFNIEALPYLTGLDLSMNEFAQFPYEVLYVSSLTELRMAGQYQDGRRCLKEWPQNIQEHMSLRVLDLSGNDIGTAGNFPTLLNSLDVSDNPNIYLLVPELIVYRIQTGTFRLIFDEDQNVVPE